MRKQGVRRSRGSGGRGSKGEKEGTLVAAARESPWCGVVVRRRLCLRNPFRESAERGTQTSEWGKNSVSLPVLHPFSLARPLALRARCHSISLSLFYHFIFLFRAPSLSLFLSLSLSAFLDFSLSHPHYSLRFPRQPLFSPRVSSARSLASLSRLRGNQAERKLDRRLVAGNIYKP